MEKHAFNVSVNGNFAVGKFTSGNLAAGNFVARNLRREEIFAVGKFTVRINRRKKYWCMGISL